MKNTIYQTNKLCKKERKDIKELAEKYKSESNLYFKIDPQIFTDESETYNNIFCYEEERLLGCFLLATFDGIEMECTAIVNRSESFEKMLSIALKISTKRGVKALLLVIDKNDDLVRECAISCGFKEKFAEHRMFLNLKKFTVNPNEIIIRKAEMKDTKIIEAFDDDKQPILESDIKNFKLAEINGEIVAQIRVEENGGLIGIYGFTVRENLRGKGIGRKILNCAISSIPNYELSKIYLEVETENAPALHLYESCGFEIQSTFCYFEQEMQEINDSLR